MKITTITELWRSFIC